MNLESTMKVLWFEFWMDIRWLMPPSDSLEGTWDIIKTCYSEPHRKYHTLEHIQHCFEGLREIYRRSCVEKDIRLFPAIIFHDLIYQPKRNNNEEQSVVWSKVLLRSLGVKDFDFLHTVENLIFATAHKTFPYSWQEQVIVDIDLSILGTSWEEFQNYRRQIREEYSHISDDDFAFGSIDFFEKKFLERPMIYHTKVFYDKYEEQARANLTRYVQNLRLQTLESNSINIKRKTQITGV